MTDREKAIIMAFTGVAMLTGKKFSIFHKYIEDLLGRPVQTIEFAFKEQEIKEKSKADFLNLCASEDPKVWIPVTERLPDSDDEVLCWYEYYHWSQEKVLPEYGLGRYFKETKAWFGHVANGKDVRVLAWMPLPEPYKGES